MNQKEREAYIRFMYDESNIGNCSQCPENRDDDGWQNRLPCGQQNCWVECHCHRE
jgi:hypothetical protein